MQPVQELAHPRTALGFAEAPHGRQWHYNPPRYFPLYSGGGGRENVSMLKRVLWLSLALVLAAGLISTGAAATEARAAGGKATPGVEAAQALSTITGVAISPLMGVGAVGAYKYFKTPEAKRGNLPWFAQPWFWAPALLLVVLVFLKDVSGTALPTALKKPFDVAEVFENKISALVAAGAFVPIVASIFGALDHGDKSMAAGMGLAFIEPAALLNFITVPLAIVVFLVVWMVAHVINVLILISPFGTVDAVLKSARLFLVGTVLASAWASPWVGALVALVIIVAAWFLSGWSMRLMVFGNVFAWDLLTLRWKRFTPSAGGDRAFTARRIDEVPVRTCGRMRCDGQGRLLFDYRPWLVLPRRTLALAEGDFSVGRGLLYPEVLHLRDGGFRTLLTLPPRCLTHEEQIARLYQMDGVQDTGLIKGMKSFWSGLKGLFTSGPKAVPA